jgi:hypothetical protein
MVWQFQSLFHFTAARKSLFQSINLLRPSFPGAAGVGPSPTKNLRQNKPKSNTKTMIDEHSTPGQTNQLEILFLLQAAHLRTKLTREPTFEQKIIATLTHFACSRNTARLRKALIRLRSMPKSH